MSVPGKYSWSLLEGLVLIPFCNWTGSCVILGVGPLLSEKHADQIWIPCGQLLLFPPGYHYFAVQKAFFHCMEVVGLRVTGGVFNHKDCNGLFIAHSLPARWPNKRCRTRQPVLVLTYPGDPTGPTGGARGRAALPGAPCSCPRLVGTQPKTTGCSRDPAPASGGCCGRRAPASARREGSGAARGALTREQLQRGAGHAAGLGSGASFELSPRRQHG